ncbi:Maff2 family protein, partial [Eubacterium callanderi]
GAGENPEITSKDYLSLSGAKSQGMKQLMAGGGVALIGLTLVPLLSGLFG